MKREQKSKIKKVQRALTTLKDEDLQELLEEDTDTCTLLTMVPGGIVAVTVCGGDVTPGAATAALAFIAEGIKRNGIPKEILVKVTSTSTSGTSQKSPK